VGHEHVEDLAAVPADVDGPVYYELRSGEKDLLCDVFDAGENLAGAHQLTDAVHELGRGAADRGVAMTERGYFLSFLSYYFSRWIQGRTGPAAVWILSFYVAFKKA